MTGPTRILLIDEDPDDRMLFGDALESVCTGCVCDTAANAEKALTMVNDHPPYDIVFMDIQLPKMDGFELVAILKSVHGYEHVPFFVLTTALSPQGIIRLEMIGVAGVLFKPSEFTTLINILKNAFDLERSN